MKGLVNQVIRGVVDSLDNFFYSGCAHLFFVF